MDRSLFLALAADLVLLLHAVLVSFIVGGLLLIIFGGARGWQWVRNPWFRLLHLLAIVVVAIQALLGKACPLTVLEMSLRNAAGEATYPGAFIAHWLEMLLYYQAPAWVFSLLYSGFAFAVAMAWWLVRPRSLQPRRD